MLTFNPQDPFSCFVTQSLSMKSAVENAEVLGVQIAEQLLAQGADKILQAIYS